MHRQTRPAACGKIYTISRCTPSPAPNVHIQLAYVEENRSLITENMFLRGPPILLRRYLQLAVHRQPGYRQGTSKVKL